MKKTSLFTLLLVLLLFGSAQAALQTIGTATYNGSDYKLIYDTDDQITWLDYSRPGSDYYSGSVAWADTLNNEGVLTINLDAGYTALWDSSQWQLPQMDGYQIPSGNVYYFTESAIYDLYYNELGNIENDPTINTGPFENIVHATPNASWYWLEPTFDSGPTYNPGLTLRPGNFP